MNKYQLKIIKLLFDREKEYNKIYMNKKLKENCIVEFPNGYIGIIKSVSKKFRISRKYQILTIKFTDKQFEVIDIEKCLKEGVIIGYYDLSSIISYVMAANHLNEFELGKKVIKLEKDKFYILDEESGITLITIPNKDPFSYTNKENVNIYKSLCKLIIKSQ